MKITQRMKDLWIANLRSGEIGQARSDWHSGEKSCCLDVLCLQETGKHYLELDIDDPALLLMHEIGFGKENRSVDKLIMLNDVQDYSFEEIADWIEKNIDTIGD